jgi:uncharacterized protein (TIGR04255 family)
MPSRPADLPEFDRPPVAEVALGVQFQTLPSLRAAHLGLLWERYKDEYPGLEEHPPLDSAIEQFDTISVEPVLDVRVLDAPLVPRCWFLAPARDRLIQVQQDRFTHNWRRVASAANYPRYETLRGAFISHFATFIKFVEEEDLGKVNVNQAEITYVNHLRLGEGWARIGELHKVIRMWSPNYGAGLSSEPENVRLAERHILSNDQGPFGRLHISLDPVISRDQGEAAVLLTLTVRGRPMGEGRAQAFSWLHDAAWLCGWPRYRAALAYRVWVRPASW